MYFADVFAICDYTLHICATPPLLTRRRRRATRCEVACKRSANHSVSGKKKTELLMGVAYHVFTNVVLVAPFVQRCMNTLHVAIRCIFAEPVSVGPSHPPPSMREHKVAQLPLRQSRSERASRAFAQRRCCGEPSSREAQRGGEGEREA